MLVKQKKCSHVLDSMAYSLIELKSNKDDVKAGEDLYDLGSILNGIQTCVDIYALDERLRKEYKTITK